jgi:glycyl-tRNA synthetase beta chain
MRNALLEIGTEEIPFSYIEPALKQIERSVLKIFGAFGLRFAGFKTYATPRRLVLIVENLIEKSDDKSEVVFGPSLKEAKNIYGNYTKAAVGFATKNGLSVEKLSVKTIDKGDYLFFVKKSRGEETEKLLSVIFPAIIKTISFPKMMVWEDSRFKFARPVRNIIALYGKKVIEFRIADVNSSNWTIGIHTYDSNRIKVDSPDDYILAMKTHCVLVDQKERYETMKKSIEFVVENIGSVIPDENLMNEVNYLVEYPSAVLCTFKQKYLNLPKEVLMICMKKHQKCFAVNGKTGRFSNHFISIKNGISTRYQETTKDGYEKVIAARLADAEFFYHNDLNDLRNGFDVNIYKLKDIIFHKKIGSVYEKICRVKLIANLFNKDFNIKLDNKVIERAIMFSKVDLASKMVFEYPELQGIMGRIYAFELGESPDIAVSIEQHYWPLTASGQLPINKIALLISMADRIDSLVTNFSVEVESSSSQDPFALKRIAVGFIRMAIKNFPTQDFGSVIIKSFEFLPENIKNDIKIKNVFRKLVSFFWQRIKNIFESKGYNSFDVEAVIISESKACKLNALGSLEYKLIALRDARQRDDFSSIVSVFKRINNIINQAKKQNISIVQNVNEALLIENIEKILFVGVKKAKIEILSYISRNEYEKVFDKVLEIKPMINVFFDKVMIMAEDHAVRLNRISILNYIKNMFIGFVDFSVLQQSKYL